MFTVFFSSMCLIFRQLVVEKLIQISCVASFSESYMYFQQE